MKIVIPGPPIAKARHRRSRRGNLIIDYDPQEKEKQNFRLKLMNEITAQINSENKQIQMEASKIASNCAFILAVVLYCPISDSSTKAQKNLKLWDLQPHNIKPDGSNFLKFVEDCANEILFADDAQIVEGSFYKRYSTEPRTEIYIMPIEKNDSDLDKILSIFGPDDLLELSKQALEITYYSNLFKDEDFWNNSSLQNRTIRMKMKKDIAAFVSILADNHSKKLSKIAKECPGYWKKQKVMPEIMKQG